MTEISPEIIEEILSKYDFKHGKLGILNAIKLAYKKGFNDFIEKDVKADERLFNFAYNKAIDDCKKLINEKYNILDDGKIMNDIEKLKEGNEK